jgi:hypothetical protein
MGFVRSAVVLSMCGLVFAGCGGGGSTPAPAPTATAAPAPTPTAAPLTASYVFAGDASGTTTVEYGLTGTAPIATLSATGAPNAFAFDASGNVYVAFGGATVEEHAAGTHRLIRTITGFHHVNDIALDAKGVLYVVDGNDTTITPIGPSTLAKVLPRATSPSSVLLSFPVVVAPYFTTLTTLITVAVDSGGSVYAGATNSGIYVFAPGATAPTRTFSVAPQSPTSLVFDRSGSLYLYASLLTPGQVNTVIYRYPPGSSTPIAVGDATYGTTPQSLAFDASNDYFQLDDPYGNGYVYFAGDVGESAAAGTGKVPIERTFNFPFAIAADPASNLYVLDSPNSGEGQTPGAGEHLSEYAFSSATPTRTFTSSGSAIGLSNVP